MAELLRTFDWSMTSKHNTHARTRTYDWDAWLDGRIRRLTKGEDFDGPTTSMERVIRTSANRKGIKVRVRVEDEDSIILQAHNDDARTAPRGVTRSPSKADVDAAREAGNAIAVKTLTKRVITKAPAPSVNGNAAKRPTKKAAAAVPTKARKRLVPA